MKAKVSIVVPIYNTEKYLEQCLQSLLYQTYKNIEIILINDGSQKSVESICKSFCKQDKRIRYFYQENRGVSAARNLGIQKATGEYICFVDSDDYVSSTFIGNFMTNVTGDCDLVTSLTSNSPILSLQGYTVKEYCDENKYDFIYEKFSGYLCNKLFKTKIIKENNLLLDEDIFMCEDVLFLYKYLMHSKKVLGIDIKNYYYRLLSTTASNNYKNIKWFSIFKSLKEIYWLHDNYNSHILNEVVYMIHRSYYEGLYRLKYVEEKKEAKEYLSSIKELLPKIAKDMDLKAKIKISIFKTFPTIVMKYRRRKVGD